MARLRGVQRPLGLNSGSWRIIHGVRKLCAWRLRAVSWRLDRCDSCVCTRRFILLSWEFFSPTTMGVPFPYYGGYDV